MLLAEKGLPSSTNAGYELFDKLGSIGLTSFMQEVTRVRALEGEIARTIQGMSGVKAARVHIVLPDSGSFRRNRQPPSASVIVRTESAGDFSGAPAIRHLVAAAVSGMTVDQVTVLSTDGTILASGGDSVSASPAKMMGLEKIHRPGAAGQHRQDADALSGLQQLRDQRGRAPQHRQAGDQRDRLQSRDAGRALRARHQGDGQPAEHQLAHPGRRRAERAGRAGDTAPPATSRSAPTSAARSSPTTRSARRPPPPSARATRSTSSPSRW